MTILDDLLTAEGPIASVYLRASSTTADAEHRFEIRWKNARRRLVDEQAPDAVLARLDEAAAAVEGHARATMTAGCSYDGQR